MVSNKSTPALRRKETLVRPIMSETRARITRRSALALMLGAIPTYLATLDDSDPSALPEAVEHP